MGWGGGGGGGEAAETVLTQNVDVESAVVCVFKHSKGIQLLHHLKMSHKQKTRNEQYAFSQLVLFSCIIFSFSFNAKVAEHSAVFTWATRFCSTTLKTDHSMTLCWPLLEMKFYI